MVKIGRKENGQEDGEICRRVFDDPHNMGSDRGDLVYIDRFWNPFERRILNKHG